MSEEDKSKTTSSKDRITEATKKVSPPNPWPDPPPGPPKQDSGDKRPVTGSSKDSS